MSVAPVDLLNIHPRCEDRAVKPKDRTDLFETKAREYFSVRNTDAFNVGWGVSSRARVIDHGIQLGVFNLDTDKPGASQQIICSYVDIPPHSQVYFAVQIHSGLKELNDWKKEMVRRGVAGEAGFSSRLNNVRFYLSEEGRIYLLNKSEWDDMSDVDLSTQGPGIAPDALMIAIYPPAASVSRGIGAREFLAQLARAVRSAGIHEIPVWPGTSTLSPEMRRLPASISLGDIQNSISASGGQYSDAILNNYHAGLNFHPSKHFVILAGISGTGKTKLAIDYARAVHGLLPGVEDPLLFVCAVRPEWTDPTGLTGYFDVLSGRYVVPPFLQAVLTAAANPDSPVFVVLDEMNLARVEYYFSDILSAMETHGSLQLHSSSTALEGSTGEEIRAELPLPHNLYITGTINIDESTQAVSDKVLDRAMLIDMSTVDLSGFLETLTVTDPALESACKAAAPLLLAVHTSMAAHRQQFGYRAAEEFVRYLHFSTSTLGRGEMEVMDGLFVQKILVRLRGSERQRGLLEDLSRELAGLPESVKVLRRLTDDLDETGSFQNLR